MNNNLEGPLVKILLQLLDTKIYTLFIMESHDTLDVSFLGL